MMYVFMIPCVPTVGVAYINIKHHKLASCLKANAMIPVNNSKGRLLLFLRASVAVIFRRHQPNTQNGNQLYLIYLLAASVEKRISFVISR